MYGYQNWVLIVASMACFTTSYGDTFRSGQGATEDNYDAFFPDNSGFLSPGRREISQENYRHQNVQYDKGQNGDSVRHTHTSTRVVLPDADRFRNIPTTTRSNVKQEANTKNQLNTSNTPHVVNRSSNKRKSQVVEDESRMVYPTELEEQVSQNTSVIFRSRSCFHGLCDEVEGYPTEMVNRILSQSKDLKKFFSTKISEVIVTTTPKINSRFGEGGSAVEPLCMTQTQTRYPQSAVNMKNVEQLLVNVDNYKQGIAYETCASADEPCRFSKTFPQDYISSCTQRYTVRKLMVVSKESDNPVFDDFRIPSCCVCTVKMVVKT